MSCPRFTTCCLILLICFSSLGLAKADVVIDQSNPENPGSDLDFIVNLGLDQSQIITVGRTGQLTQVELFVRRQAETMSPLIFDVRNVSGSVPAVPTEPNVGANVLATTTLASSSISLTDDWQVFDISGAGLSVTDGDSLALTLRSEDAAGYIWSASNENAYADGENFLRVANVGDWTSNAETFQRPTDQVFRTTVTTGPVVVPEPTAITPLALAGLLFSRRRFRILVA